MQSNPQSSQSSGKLFGRLPQELEIMISSYLTLPELAKGRLISKYHKPIVELCIVQKISPGHPKGYLSFTQAFESIKDTFQGKTFQSKVKKKTQEAVEARKQITEKAKNSPEVALIAVLYTPSLELLLTKSTCIKEIANAHSDTLKKQIPLQALYRTLKKRHKNAEEIVQGCKILDSEYQPVVKAQLYESLAIFNFAHAIALIECFNVPADPKQLQRLIYVALEEGKDFHIEKLMQYFDVQPDIKQCYRLLLNGRKLPPCVMDFIENTPKEENYTGNVLVLTNQ